MYTTRIHKVWIEISKAAAARNVASIRSLIEPTTKLFAVIKSNAYGHGLFVYAKILSELGVDGFCVDSTIEAVRLREQGITGAILVIGPTLPALYDQAAAHQLTLSISNMTELSELATWQKQHTETPLSFHLKIDTGMHRRGFLPEEIPAVISALTTDALTPHGVYSHFAAAKDPAQTADTANQFKIFIDVCTKLHEAGYTKLLKHIGATSSTMTSPEYQLDAVRIGIGLYGIFPSEKLAVAYAPTITLTPALSMHTLIAEVKMLAAGERIGYDFTETLTRPTRVAILPIGYWHGIPRALSSQGEVLIGKTRCRILGIVSMDMIAVDATEVACAVGDQVTIIGSSSEGGPITARELAQRARTTPHEILVRLNPLIERSSTA